MAASTCAALSARENGARVLMLESGDVDLILNIPPEDIPRLRKDPRFAVEVSNIVAADLERNEWPGFADLLALVDHLIVSAQETFSFRKAGLL